MLAKIGKADLVDQLVRVRQMSGPGVKRWKVRIARSSGALHSVHAVRKKDGRDWVCPLGSPGGPLARLMAGLLGRKPDVVDLDGLIRALSESDATDVVIGWPGSRSHSIVVKVFAVASGDGCCTVYLFPGPPDIDKVNEEIREYIRAHGCPSPAHADDCGECPRLMECGVLEAAEAEARRKRAAVEDDA